MTTIGPSKSILMLLMTLLLSETLRASCLVDQLNNAKNIDISEALGSKTAKIEGKVAYVEKKLRYTEFGSKVITLNAYFIDVKSPEKVFEVIYDIEDCSCNYDFVVGSSYRLMVLHVNDAKPSVYRLLDCNKVVQLKP